MNVIGEREDGALVIIASGRIDAINSPDFHRAAKGLLTPRDHSAVLDLEGVTFLSSSGLRAVLRLAREFKARKGRLVVCSVALPVRDAFAISGFDQVVDIAGDRPSAVRTATRPDPPSTVMDGKRRPIYFLRFSAIARRRGTTK